MIIARSPDKYFHPYSYHSDLPPIQPRRVSGVISLTETKLLTFHLAWWKRSKIVRKRVNAPRRFYVMRSLWKIQKLCVSITRRSFQTLKYELIAEVSLWPFFPVIPHF